MQNAAAINITLTTEINAITFFRTALKILNEGFGWEALREVLNSMLNSISEDLVW